tara:strand:+ start:381 stop:608 length:228 start_codon:yes stop_codon:yes gene_type:complete
MMFGATDPPRNGGTLAISIGAANAELMVAKLKAQTAKDLPERSNNCLTTVLFISILLLNAQQKISFRLERLRHKH